VHFYKGKWKGKWIQGMGSPGKNEKGNLRGSKPPDLSKGS